MLQGIGDRSIRPYRTFEDRGPVLLITQPRDMILETGDVNAKKFAEGSKA